MKKSMLVASVIAFLTLMASMYCFADVTGVTDTSKEGSLLVWPLVQTNGDNDTYIVITNSIKGGSETGDEPIFDDLVNIKCYWEARRVPYVEGSGNYCPISDAMFTLSVNNPRIFRASDGTDLEGNGVVPGVGKEMKGMLKCWVVSPNDINQISWNHLSGYAIIVQPEEEGQPPSPPPKQSAWKYSAWRFAANVVADDNGTEFADGFWVGKTTDAGNKFNMLRLWGANKVVSSPGACPNNGGQRTTPIRLAADTYYCVERVDLSPGSADNNCTWPDYAESYCAKRKAAYDACPQYLLFNFLAEPSQGQEDSGHAENYLALAPCKEDLRGEDDEGELAEGAFDFPTKLVFSIWNSNEVKFTGTYSCAHCNGGPAGTYDVYLKDLRAGSVCFFEEYYLHTNSGRFRVEGQAANAGKCAGAKATPLIGIMASRLYKPDSIDLVATGGTGAGARVSTTGNNPGYIYWNPSEEVVEKTKR